MKDNYNDILIENGWNIICESPFEIEHNEDLSFASLNAAHIIRNELLNSEIINKLILIKDAYKNDLIDKDIFVLKTLEEIEKL